MLPRFMKSALMSDSITVVTAYALVALGGARSSKNPDGKCPNACDYHLDSVGGIMKPYFTCDFTSRTWERGFAGPSCAFV